MIIVLGKECFYLIVATKDPQRPLGSSGCKSTPIHIWCANHETRPSTNWVNKIYILFDNISNIGCANAYPTHPALPALT